MTNGQWIGLVGGICGGLIGVAGGIVGTYFSIKNTSGPKERAFTIKSSMVCWAGIIVFLALLFLLPNPYRWLVWIPYGILLPIGIIYGNKKQQKIRGRESQNKQTGHETAR